MEGSIYEVPHNNNVSHIVEGKDLGTLIVDFCQYMCMWVRLCVYSCLYMCVRVCLHVCIRVCAFMCTCKYVCLCARVFFNSQ